MSEMGTERDTIAEDLLHLDIIPLGEVQDTPVRVLREEWNHTGTQHMADQGPQTKEEDLLPETIEIQEVTPRITDQQMDLEEWTTQ